ncbi:MAG: radical SAM protein [Candidatus Thiodiazotropha sp.]
MPGGSPFSPPLSILALGSYLRKNGIDATTIDISSSYFHYTLNPELFQKHYEITHKTLKGVKENITIASDHATVSKFLQRLWIPEGYNHNMLVPFHDAITLIGDARKILQLPYHPVKISAEIASLPSRFRPINWSFRRFWDRKAETINSGHPLLRYCEEYLIPKLKAINPELIGVSINYSEQAHHSYILIDKISKLLNIPIVVGGTYFHDLFEGRPAVITTEDENYVKIAPMLRPYGILGEGEKPLLQLCNSLATGQSVDNIPGLFYQQGQNILLYPEGPPIETDDLPIIDLSLLQDKNKYLSPMKIAPLMTSRGCYWNKCAFCDHANTLQSVWRELDVSLVAENMHRYKEEHHIEYVVLCDESTSPRMLERLSRELIKTTDRVFFGTMVRFEKKIIKLIEPLAKAGCRSLSFGLESGAQRVVDKMGKGYELQDAERILELCEEYGISVELFIMFGFPSERLSEASQTIEFLEKHQSKIDSFRANPWYWKKDSPIGMCPTQFSQDADKASYPIAAEQRPIENTTGVTKRLAMELVRSLAEHEALGDKIIHHSPGELRQEEYHVIARFCKGNNQPNADVG